ncbi:MAG: hypothetical protein HY565_01080 [Candidatus Kerfeldbacteria bacterium]|nr:hypothetical protein [Candidatus Kerfeldbacteria bacterium]
MKFPHWLRHTAVSVISVACLLLPQHLHSTSVAWQQTNGPLGGVVSKLITINGEVIASLYSGGLYRYTTDGWEQIGINYGLPDNRAFDIVADPTDSTRIYTSMMIACGSYSTDGGDSWEAMCGTMLEDLGIDNFSSDTVLVDPSDPSIIYLAGRDHDNTAEVLRSTDQGVHWEVWSTFSDVEYFNHLVAFDNKFYLATRTDGVYVSDDSGASWTTLNAGLNETGMIRFATNTDTNQLYVATGLFQYNVRTGGNIYTLSADQTTWEAVTGPDEVTGIAWNDGRLWAGTVDGEVWRTNNSGALKLRNADNLAPGFVGEFTFTADQLFIGVGGYGVYTSTDHGQTVQPNNAGLKSMAMREIIVHKNNPDKYYALTFDRFGLYRTTNGGDSYKVIAPDNYFLTMVVDPQDFKHLYAGSGDYFYDIQVKGKTATVTTRDTPGPRTGNITTLAVHPTNSKIVLAGISNGIESPDGSGVYRSTDAGRTWKRSKGVPRKGVFSIIYNPNNPQVVYAAAFSGGVYKSDNGGKRFSQIGGDALQYTYRLAMSPTDPDILVAGSNLFLAGLSTADQTSGLYGGIFKTTDGGDSWTEITAGIRTYFDDGGAEGEEFEVWKYNFGHLPNYEMMLISPTDPDVIIVGQHGENVVVTNDSGATWSKPVSGMIPGSMHNYAYCLGTNLDFERIYSCTCGRGMFRGTFSAETQTLSWDDTTTTEPADASQPSTAAEARDRILSEVDVHQH